MTPAVAVRVDHLCRACDGEGSFARSCPRYGMTGPHERCCGDTGIAETKCKACGGRGRVATWEDVADGIRARREAA